jgi:hypothetical protein
MSAVPDLLVLASSRQVLTTSLAGPYLTFSWQGFLRRIHRWLIILAHDTQPTNAKPDDHSASLAHRPLQAREQPDDALACVLLFPMGQTAHLRHDASIRYHKCALDKQHRLPPAEASLGTLRLRASGPPSCPQTVRARHAAATPASLFEITQTLAAPAPVHPRLVLAIVPCNQDSAER